MDKAVDVLLAIERMAKPAQREAVDYIGEDGLLVCGKCKRRKQFRGVLLGTERILPTMCRCQQEAVASREREKKRTDAIRTVKELRSLGIHELKLKDWTLAKSDNRNSRLMRATKAYADRFGEMKRAGKGLLLYGGCGTGKTYAAACIVNELIDNGVPCLMTNFSRVLNSLWGVKDKQEYLDSLNRFDLLVLDDLGAERQSEYVAEQVFNVIDNRYRAKLPLIVTTNMSLRELTSSKTTNSRIYDRILEMCHPIEVAGESRRKEKLKNDYQTMNELLGLTERES